MIHRWNVKLEGHSFDIEEAEASIGPLGFKVVRDEESAFLCGNGIKNAVDSRNAYKLANERLGPVSA